MKPSKIDVMGAIYDVEYSTDTSILQGDEEVLKVGSEVMGYTNSISQHMVVRDEVGFNSIRDTLLHETLHAVFSMTVLDLTLSRRTAEDVVSRLSPALLDVLRSNPELVSYLTEKEL